ncbi:hypothetical protein ACOMHN_014736 [Nucella lapillus]
MVVGLVAGALVLAIGCIVGAWYYQKKQGNRQKDMRNKTAANPPSKSILKKVSSYALTSKEESSFTVGSSSDPSFSSTTNVTDSSSFADKQTDAALGEVIIEARM